MRKEREIEVPHPHCKVNEAPHPYCYDIEFDDHRYVKLCLLYLALISEEGAICYQWRTKTVVRFSSIRDISPELRMFELRFSVSNVPLCS